MLRVAIYAVLALSFSLSIMASLQEDLKEKKIFDSYEAYQEFIDSYDSIDNTTAEIIDITTRNAETINGDFLKFNYMIGQCLDRGAVALRDTYRGRNYSYEAEQWKCPNMFSDFCFMDRYRVYKTILYISCVKTLQE